MEATSRLALEVELNGRPTGLIGEFIDLGGGDLAAHVPELEAIGFSAARLPTGAGRLVRLAAVPGLSTDYDEAAQRLAITAPPELLKVTQVAAHPRTGPARLAPASTGAVLNYALIGSASRSRIAGHPSAFNGAAQLEGRIFSRFGVLSSASVATAPARGSAKMVRLDTHWTYEDPQRLTVARVGDLVNSGLSWTRPVRLAGVQLSRNFSLRPDLVTMPVPFIRGTAQTPSTLDMFVDGAKVYSGKVPAGPFEARAGAPSLGAGTTQVVVRDLLGRESRLALPFYASEALLAPGLLDFGVEAGFARRDFGFKSNRYNEKLILSGSARYGVSDRLTLQAHGEGSGRLVNIGGGAAVALRQLALASVAASASASPRGKGGSLDLGLEARHRSFSGSLRTFRTFGAYEDVASMTSQKSALSDFDLATFRAPKRVDQAQVTSRLWREGAQLSLSYARVRQGRNDVRLATLGASYMVRGTSLYARGWKDFTSLPKSWGVALGVSVPFGRRTIATTELAVNDRRLGAVAEVASLGTDEPGSFAWRARLAEGPVRDRLAAVSYLGSSGRVEAGLQQTAGGVSAFAQAGGSIALVDGSLFASRRIGGAFAVADAGAAGVPVIYENRAAGRTGRSGRLLIPSLVAYQGNRIAFDTLHMPVNQAIATDSFVVAPREGSVVVVRLARASASTAALVSFVDESGMPLPAGTSGRVGMAGEFLVGYDGEAFIEGLKRRNSVTLERADKSRCHADFGFPDKPEGQVRIGPVRCSRLTIAEGAPEPASPAKSMMLTSMR